MLETVNKDGRKHEYSIGELQVYRNYLHYKRNYINHPYHEHIEYHLFPEENIGIYTLTQYQNVTFDKSELYKYYVDMVSVEKVNDRWIIKDLFLDFIVKCDGNHYVVDIDEFKDAINETQLDKKDISSALAGLDNVLKGYYKSFDMNKFIDFLILKYSKDEMLFSSQA
jgi:hypothetical protein